MQTQVYKRLATLIQARLNCIASNNVEWKDRHEESIKAIQAEYLPSGSGVDMGCNVDLDASNGDKIVILSSYHCMDENGYYDGWADFTVTVTASLQFDYSLSIKSRNGCSKQFAKYDLGEYLHDTFRYSLDQIIE